MSLLSRHVRALVQRLRNAPLRAPRNPKRLLLECLEDRLAPATFTDNTPTLNIDLDVAGDSVSIVSAGAVYTLTLAAGNWNGTDVAGEVTGSGTPTLTVTAAPFLQVNITDSAASTAVTFANSGANSYASGFSVTLDDVAAGTITFNGSSSFSIGNLTASTTGNVLVNAGVTVSVTGGDLILEGGDGISLAATATATASGSVTLNVGNLTAADADGSSSTLSGTLTAGTTAAVQGGTGADSVTVGLANSQLLNVSLNAGADTLAFAAGKTLNGGTFDGGTEIDTLDYSAYTTPVSVNLGLNAPTATGLTATLGSDQEVPSTGSTATGTATITYDVATKTFSIAGAVSGIPVGTVTGFHIHRAPVGVNGSIIVDLVGIVPLVDDGMGGFTFNTSGIALPAQHEAALLGGITYLNVHTPTNTTGAIRGQIFSTGNANVAGTATGTAGVSNVENAIGGSGDDSLVGNNQINVLTGNDGADTIVAGPGGPLPARDIISGGDGDDVMVWSNGDGSDTMDGGIGNDLVQVNGALVGANLNDNFLVAAGAGGRLSFDRTNFGNFNLDIGTTETLNVNGIVGNETFNVNDLTGVTDLSLIRLGGFAGNDTFNINNSAVAVVNVKGGTENDTTVFANTATLNGGTYDGDQGTDTLDYSAYTTAVNVNLGLNATGGVLTSTLGSDQEVPPTTSMATGTATITYDVATKTFSIAGAVSGIPVGTVTGFHIHRAPVGVNGPIIVDLVGIVPLVDDGVGGFTFNTSGIALPAQHEAALLGGITYLNIHTATFTTGAIRGQIFSTGNANVPGTATGTAGVSNVENAIGGSGDDSLVGNNQVNVLTGNGGNDTSVGGPGADTFAGGIGDDIMVWSNGDGSDIMDGQANNDLVQVNGNLTATDTFNVGAGLLGRVAFARTGAGPFTLDIGTTETLTVNGIGGDDIFNANDLTGVTDLTTINLNGFAGNDAFNVMPSATAAINVTGGNPNPLASPGDTLGVNTAGAMGTAAAITATAQGYSGTWTFTNRQMVQFKQVETLAGVKLMVASQPSSVQPGQSFQVAVQVQDANGTPLMFNGPVTLMGLSGPSAVAVAVNAMGGMATFSLSLPLAGTYLLQATAPGIQSVNLSPITAVALTIQQAGGLLVLGGPPGAEVPVAVRVLSRNSALFSEIGVFVLDANGKINGLAPGQRGFLRAALRRGRRIIFRNGRAVGNASVLKQLAGQQLLFYIIPKNAPFVFTGLAKANPDRVKHLRIKPLGGSRFRLSWEATFGGGDRDFNDVVLEVSLGR